MTLRRRTMIGSGAALLFAGAAPLPVPDANKLLFQVVRGGGVIGTHRLDFIRSGSDLTVNVNVVMAISFGPIPLFHYHHHAVENWQGGECVSLEAETDHNGTKFKVVAHRDASGWDVTGSKGKLRAPPETLPATHWNKAMLNGPMINTETGSVMRPAIAELGWQKITAAGGGTITAEHYRLSGDADMDTWYDDTPSWAGAAFTGGDGSTIRYVKS